MDALAVMKAIMGEGAAGAEGRVGWLCIGVDGGGTKTKAMATYAFPEGGARADDDLQVGSSFAGGHAYLVVGKGVGGSANQNSVGTTRAVESVSRAVQEALESAHKRLIGAGGGKAPVEVALSICLSLSGVDRQGDEVPFEEGLKSMLERSESGSIVDRDRVVINVVNDAYAALASGLFVAQGARQPHLSWCEDQLSGMVLIVGTGTIAFGVRESESGEIERHRVGGWGCTFGDDGSGYDVAYRSFCAIARCHDGRDPRETSLTGKVLARLGLSQPMQLIPWAYGEGKEWAKMADLAPLCLEGAAEGDKVCAEIIGECTTALAGSVAALRRRLFGGEGAPPIVLVGGLVSAENPLARGLQEKLRTHGDLRGSEIIRPRSEAVLGAAAMAQKWGQRRHREDRC